MVHNRIWDTLAMLKQYLLDNYDTYADLLRSAASEPSLPTIKSVEIGNDYTKKGLVKPFIMLDPVRMIIDDEAIGLVNSDLSIDVLFAVESYSYTDEQASKWVMLYADAFQSMVLSDDTLGDEIAHASVEDIEFYPGGTGTTKYVLLNVVISIETDRS